jgi:acyl transferase domain-containing protein/aryl carrier-like protein
MSLLPGQGRRLPRVGWQFTGQGSQFAGMAAGLYSTYEVFRQSIDQCDEELRHLRNGSLKKILFEPNQTIHHTAWTQPAIFAVQMGLAKLLQSWNLHPDVVLGHSVGQYAAACVAGVMSWETGLKMISERGRLIGDLPPGGKMLAVFAPLDKVSEVISGLATVSLAASNGTHIVISGPGSGIREVESQFEKLEIRTKPLTTSHAFHSALMEPALGPFEKFAENFEFETAKIPLICNVSGIAIEPTRILNGRYWANHIRQAVRYSESVDTAQELGCDVMLELGPQSVLTRMAAANWRKPAGTLISCLQKESEHERSFLKAVSQLFTKGCRPDFAAMFKHQPRRPVLLPTYPFQRRRFWGPDKPRAAHAEYHTAHPLLGSPIVLAGAKQEKRFESFIDLDSPSWLPDHEVMGHTVFPGAAFLEMAIAAAGSDEIAQAVFAQPLRLNGRTALQTVVRNSEQGHRVMETFSCPAQSSHWSQNFSANLVASSEASTPNRIDLASLESTCSQTVKHENFYARLSELGLNYGPSFQTVDSLQVSRDQTQVLSKLVVRGDIRGFSIPPTVLDGALHSLAVGLLNDGEENLFLPVGIGRLRCLRSVETDCWCLATWQNREGKTRSADLVLFDNDGQVLVKLEKLQVQQVSVAALRQMSGTGSERMVYDLEWEPIRLPANKTNGRNWLLVSTADQENTFQSVEERLREQGHEVVRLLLDAGSEITEIRESCFRMGGRRLENWHDLMAKLSYVGRTPQGVTWCLDGPSGLPRKLDSIHDKIQHQTREHVEGLLNLICSLSTRGFARLECGLLLLTSDAISMNDAEPVNPWQMQFWGLGRVIGAEQPELRCRLLDRDSKTTFPIEAIVEVMLTETADNQLVLRDGKFYVPRLKKATLKSSESSDLSLSRQNSYLITGGLGKLGRQAAKWLAENGAGQVVLVSRRTPDETTQEFLRSFNETNCDVVVHRCDITSEKDIKNLFSRFGDDLQPLDGVIHAAGLVDDALIADQDWPRFEAVLKPKVIGASWLDRCTRDQDLSFFVLYSSAASLLGSPGQSNYATANAFMDGLAAQRRSAGLPAVSINWGPWTEGMADDERIIKRLKLQGIRPLTADESHAAMEQILSTDIGQSLVMDVDWRKMKMGMGGDSTPMLQRLTPARQRSQVGDSELVAKLKQMRGSDARELLVKTISGSLQNILSTPDLPETDRPLIEMGLDSLMAVEFGTELQQILGDGFSVGPTMLFDHPTIDAISDHVLELATAGTETNHQTESRPSADTVSAKPMAREDIAIIGMSCRFPGAQNTDQFWQNLMNGVDSVNEIPSDRWDIDRFYDADRAPGKMYTRHGGFLPDIADFDAAFFNISDQEACWIDPQHRMLLENSYRALEHAGIATAPMADANVGVFMGIMGQDYAFLPTLDDSEVITAFQGAGLSHSAGVGRISYVFGFEGPSVAVDTASSSSLVALFQAVRCLQDRNCNLALAGGVNAILAPVNSLLMSKAGLLSPDGRCKSFSAAADGFGRGEGCGVVVLKRLSDAQRDGDRVLAVVRGGAVVHNGFTSGITAPSGKSQARVIAEALKDAKIAPSQVQYLEAHGTGTEYGDPMELGAAAGVYGKGRQPDQPLLVGSVKANISHLEAAGGISGLIKTVLCLQHGMLPPQAHFDEPSPHIPWRRMPLQVVTEPTPWPETTERLAGVTALGLVGTNAHVILSAPPQGPAAESDAGTHGSVDGQRERPTNLLVLSARSNQALIQLERDYLTFLEQSDSSLADICFTAGTGRRHFEHRLAITAGDRDELKQKLRKISATTEVIPAGKQNDRSNGHATGQAGKNGSTNGQAVNPIADGALIGERKKSPKLGWVFGNGHYVSEQVQTQSARELFATDPAFARLITEFDERLASHFGDTYSNGERLLDWLTGEQDQEVQLTDVHRFALQSGIALVLKSFEVEPDIVTGWGLGQYTAACISGVLCFKDAMILVAEGEKISLPPSLQDFADVSRQPFGGKTESDTEDGASSSEDRRDEARLDEFESLADQFNYYPPNLPLVCSLSGELVPVHRSLGGSYWRKHHASQPMSNESITESVKTAIQSGCDQIIEFGCEPTAFRDPNEKDNLSVEVVAFFDERETATGNVFRSLARLYVTGFNPNFAALAGFGSPQKIGLPSYPFQKKRYWITEITDHMEMPKETAKP